MKLSSLACCGVLLGLLMGCGEAEPDHGPLGTLKGKVTFNGQPFTQGTLILSRDGGGSGAAPLQSDGTFLVTDRIGGIPVGTYKIGFQAETKEVASNPNSPPSMQAVLVLPKKYYSTETSELSVEVKEGENSLEFDVSK